MSSIEKAIERLIEKNKSRASLGAVENTSSIEKTKDFDEKVQAKKRASEELKERVPEVKPEKNIIADKSKPSADKKVCNLDFNGLADAGFLSPLSKNRLLFEEYRVIKRPLLMNAFGKGASDIDNGNLIAITSAYSKEGKSFTSLNLAFSIALEMDTTILLIDSDVIKRSLSKQLGLENELGLLDILNNADLDIGDVIIGTNLPRLNIIPAGQESSSATELLASTKMSSVLTELSERYPDRVIIFDAPPLLATTEASVIMHGMGQIMLVVEAGKTANDAIRSAIDLVDDKDKVVGVILNKSRSSRGAGYYGYGSEE